MRPALAAALGLALTLPASAVAAPTATRLTGVVVTDGALRMSVGLWDIFAPEDRKRLSSGFATRVLIRVYLQPLGGGPPVVRTFQAGEIVYDLWGERYEVRVSGPQGSRLFVEAHADAAIRRATSLWQLPLGPVAGLDPQATYVIGVRGDLNPISDELVADMRRWLLRSPTPRGGGAAGFMGSFVSIFMNPRLEDSERQLLFFSQKFRVADLLRTAPGGRP